MCGDRVHMEVVTWEGRGNREGFPQENRKANRPGRAHRARECDSIPSLQAFWAAHVSQCPSNCVQFILTSAHEATLPTGESPEFSVRCSLTMWTFRLRHQLPPLANQH